MECLGLDDLGGQPNGSSMKIALATLVMSHTVVTNLWIARRFQMGDPSSVSRHCAETKAREDVRKTSKPLEKAGSKS
jgi:hypothetical protein